MYDVQPWDNLQIEVCLGYEYRNHKDSMHGSHSSGRIISLFLIISFSFARERSSTYNNKAINMDLRALEIELMDRRKSLGCSHMGVAETLNIIGLTHHHMTNNQMEALRCHQEALQILKIPGIGNAHDYYIALTQCDIGNIHWKIGNYLEAGIAYTEAMNLFERTKTKKTNPGLQMASKRIFMLGIEWTPEKTSPQDQDPNDLSRHLTASHCQEAKTPKSHRSARERGSSTTLLATKRKLDRDSRSPKKENQSVKLVPEYYLTGHHQEDLLAGLLHSSCPNLTGASNRVKESPRRDTLALVWVDSTSTVLLPTKKRMKLDRASQSPKKNSKNVVLLSGYLPNLEILPSKGHHQDVKVASGDLLAGLSRSSCPSLMGAIKQVDARGELKYQLNESYRSIWSLANQASPYPS